MSEAKVNDSVQIHFTAKLEDGTVVASTDGEEPLEFVVGSNTLIPGLENAVEGMTVGQQVSEKVPPEQAFGPFRDELVISMDRKEFPDGEIAVGQQFEAQGADGERRPITVVEVAESEVTVDANHPLAGKPITFDVELVAIA